MHIKNHTINVSHGAFGGMLGDDVVTASHEMTIRFNASLDGGADGWIDDLIDAIAGLAKEQTVFLTRPDVNKVRDEYRAISRPTLVSEGGAK